MSDKSGKFDAYAPFEKKELLDETLKEFENFEYKLYGKIPLKFHRGNPNKFEFDLNVGQIHFTEQDFLGISAFMKKINEKWGTPITFCVYTPKDGSRNMIINVRSPKAPVEME